MMKKYAILIIGVLILAVFNYSIYEKEQVIKNGEVVLLELAPVDPRSLMQGDYMALRYDLENTARGFAKGEKKRGFIVVTLDNDRVAHFKRFWKGEELSPEERRIKYQLEYTRVWVKPDSFFFQEGHAKYYENAKYGVFRFDDDGNHVLTGMADANKKIIIPPLDQKGS